MRVTMTLTMTTMTMTSMLLVPVRHQSKCGWRKGIEANVHVAWNVSVSVNVMRDVESGGESSGHQ